jgi:endoglucanase
MVTDERYWAAAELYRATGEAEYHEAFRQHYKQGGFSLHELGWADVGGYGTLAYLLLEPSKTDSELRNALHAGWIEKADEYIRLAEASGYQVAMGTEDYIWGSSMVLMNRAMHLILAERMTGEGRYRDAALSQSHYLLGQNPCISAT